MKTEENIRLDEEQIDTIKELLTGLWAHQQGGERNMVEVVEETRQRQEDF